MKRLIQIIYFSLLIVAMHTDRANSQSSVYHPFPDSNAVWVVQGQGCCVTNCPSPPTPNPVITDHNISYYIQGDTVVNNLTYHKIYRSGSIYEHCLFGSSVNNWISLGPGYIGAIRQDTALKKVYFLQLSSGTECTLYDFDLAVGDTINNGCMWNSGNCAIVTSIDSIMIGSSYRKKFNLSTIPQYSLIEGIGSTAGFYEPVCPFEYTANLVCFSEYGQTLYPDTVTNCSILASLSQVIETHDPIFSPNPFQDQAVFKPGPSFIGSELIVYNSLGRIVRIIPIENHITKIERGNLNAGVYFYHCINSTGTVLYGKIIIN